MQKGKNIKRILSISKHSELAKLVFLSITQVSQDNLIKSSKKSYVSAYLSLTLWIRLNRVQHITFLLTSLA